MKKKPIIFSVCLCLILILTSCGSSEKNGVSESVILNSSIYDVNATKLEIIHDVDTDAHLDHVQVILNYESEYGIREDSISCLYQYDKSSDLWSLQDREETITQFNYNTQKLISSSPWTGTTSFPDSCTYSIAIHEIDTVNMTAKVFCDINFDDAAIADIHELQTVDLINYFPHLGFGVRYTDPSDWYEPDKGIVFYLYPDQGLTTEWTFY